MRGIQIIIEFTGENYRMQIIIHNGQFKEVNKNKTVS